MCDTFSLKAIITQNTKDMHKIILKKILSTINVYVSTECHLKGWLGNLIWWLIMKWENRKLNLWTEAQWDNAHKVFSVVLVRSEHSINLTPSLCCSSCLRCHCCLTWEREYVAASSPALWDRKLCAINLERKMAGLWPVWQLLIFCKCSCVVLLPYNLKAPLWTHLRARLKAKSRQCGSESANSVQSLFQSLPFGLPIWERHFSV